MFYISEFIQLTDEVKVENEEPPMLCSGHKLPARKLRAEKSAENRGRIFYVCDLPKKNQCKFFKVSLEILPIVT